MPQVRIAKCVLREMRERRSGTILQVTSLTAQHWTAAQVGGGLALARTRAAGNTAPSSHVNM